MLRQSISGFQSASDSDQTTFYDRGIPDTIAYAHRFDIDPAEFVHAAE